MPLTTAHASEKTVPMNLTVQATPIDVTVSNAINMTLPSNSTVMSVSDLSVKNNSAIGVVEVSKVAVTPKAGWTKVADTIDFKTLPFNTKKFSLKIADVDVANVDYSTKISVDPLATQVLKFTGQSAGVTAVVTSEVVADTVVTMSFK
ncbi:MAG: hypothetical protein RR909_03125 [Bacilli bacterium]